MRQVVVTEVTEEENSFEEDPRDVLGSESARTERVPKRMVFAGDGG